MAEHQQHASKFVVKVGGSPLAPALDASLVSAFVDDDLLLPDLFSLTFRDPNRSVLAEAGLSIGAIVEVTVFSGATPGGEAIFKGEVTGIEVAHDVDGTMTLVRGLDHSHRLFRGRITETYNDMTYSDIANAVAGRAGLGTGRVESSKTVHAQVTQFNESDWDFLSRLAREIGFEVGCLGGKFEFRAPTEAAGGPETGTLQSADPLRLTVGANLLRFRAIVTASEQVGEVQVRGWDVSRKEALVGTAPAESNGARIGTTPAELARAFGNPTYVGTEVIYGTQAEVDGAARAQAEQIASAFAEFEGVARGNPKLRAGTVVSLGLAGEPFDGTYTLTNTRHSYDPRNGYTVAFGASGRQRRSLLDLAGEAGGGRRDLVAGVVPALVTDVGDPEDLGRVKVKFPWLSDDDSTSWIRVSQLGAGKDRGAVFLPEVGDEVLVSFLHGDADRPVVVGSLWNGVDKPDLGSSLVDRATGAVRRRGFISKNGHKLVFLDDATSSGVMMSTANGGMRIALKETGTTIRINSQGQIEIEATGNVTIAARGRMELRAQAGLTIDGGPLVDIKGTVVKLN